DEKVKTIKREGQTYNRYRLTLKQVVIWRKEIGPFYLKSNLPEGTKSKMFYWAQWDGGKQPPESLELVSKTFPTPGMPKDVTMPLTWMMSTDCLGWPDFLENFTALGFNCLTIFPKDIKVLGEQAIVELIGKARKKGMTILLSDNGFFSPYSLSFGNPECRTIDTVTGKPVQDRFDGCPSYRG
ncbi:unnamed protein product, partial [marine sediment metagenome]